MNRNSNTYTFLYAAIMVIVVAAVLASVAMALKPAQKKNVEIEKKQNILASVNIESTAVNAEEIYAKTVVSEYLINTKGEKVEGNAFSADLKKEHAKGASNMLLPVFECKTDDGVKYVLPVYGAGLWGPIWGYVSVNSDMNTVYGAIFDHEGETPGLGAEISTKGFQAPFKGKTLFDQSGKMVSITVAKVGEVAPEEHKVDAISGGTITSKGLEKMLKDDFSGYEAFLIKNKK